MRPKGFLWVGLDVYMHNDDNRKHLYLVINSKPKKGVSLAVDDSG